MGKMVLKNEKFLELLNGSENELSDFVSTLQLLRKLSYTVILSDQLLEEIYDVLHISKKKEDIKIINKIFEKMFSYVETTEHAECIRKLDILAKEESNSFKEILRNDEYFDHDLNEIGYMLDIGINLRNIFEVEHLKQVLLLFSKRVHDIDGFIKELKIILSEVAFDENLESSIEELNDGFDARKNEIIYHLYCIQNEIPKIISGHISGYQNIGDAMSLDCSPERNRETVKQKLIKQVNGIDINCELHTKMKRMSTKAPDRIYFCPCVPEGIDSEIEGKILIYKITKHV
ncbi:hypothetical protein [Bacillus cereus]|uniref:hypothetical protein n=1 Tax=Bacillus cereus TaxID=1396 RepID=UPI001CBB01F2|nr:hypothetical protein [Bacillus cereus]